MYALMSNTHTCQKLKVNFFSQRQPPTDRVCVGLGLSHILQTYFKKFALTETNAFSKLYNVLLQLQFYIWNMLACFVDLCLQQFKVERDWVRRSKEQMKECNIYFHYQYRLQGALLQTSLMVANYGESFAPHFHLSGWVLMFAPVVFVQLVSNHMCRKRGL